MSNGFSINANSLVSGLSNLDNIMKLRVSAYAHTVSKDLEGYAKSHRPWTDRTGHARQRLTGYVQETSTGFRIIIAHGVDYGIWLELAKEKKYAILEPTVRLKGPDIIRGMKELLRV